MEKIKKWLKNYKISLPIAAAVFLIAAFALANGDKESKREFTTAGRTVVAQEIDVTGRVVPAKEVELAIESGGKVSVISATVGRTVASGQTLLRVDSSDLQIKLSRQQAALEKAKIALAKQEPKTNAQDDLVKAYEDGFNAVADAFLDLPAVIAGIDNVLDQEYLSSNAIRMTDGQRALDMRDATLKGYYAAEDAYDDVLKKYRAASRESSRAVIESLIVETYEATKLIADAVKKTNNFVDYIEDQTEGGISAELAEDQTRLDGYTDETNTHLTALLEIKDIINDSRKGITDERLDVTTSRIDIRQAELDIQDTLDQISERSIKSPIAGTVTDVKAEVGETIPSGDPIITVISSNQYQIEANLPEADMAKVKVGAEADVVLDAYGSDAVFKAKIVSIDPAETLIDGVATYKTVIQFVDADERIKSGMTADIAIKGERKENVLAVPQRAIIAKDGQKFVQVLKGEEVVEIPVKTGLKGTDGNIEIIEGIAEGDKIIIFAEEK
ncbi:MAG TPA: efflux RND transporter periplasmic adaptor subunit [Candidatus Paceibacterota bacterium]|nr:efflux RND transporter periplasmic adaptor subunit [Candidatus Paceibacterota bacterium]